MMKRYLALIALSLAPLCGFLAGCDESIKNTVITGLQSGATTIAGALITAGFQTLLSNTNTGTTSL